MLQFEYLCVLCDREDIFPAMLAYLQEQQIPLAGAVQDFTCPRTGENFMYFPIKSLG